MPAFTNTAEDFAARFARACGYAVLSRNDRRFGAEIDLLCQLPKRELAVFEVKRFWKGGNFLPVSHRQRDRLSRAIADLQGEAGKYLKVSLYALLVDVKHESFCVIPLAEYSSRSS